MEQMVVAVTLTGNTKKKSSLADGENRFSRDGHEQKTGFEI